MATLNWHFAESPVVISQAISVHTVGTFPVVSFAAPRPLHLSSSVGAEWAACPLNGLREQAPERSPEKASSPGLPEAAGRGGGLCDTSEHAGAFAGQGDPRCLAAPSMPRPLHVTFLNFLLDGESLLFLPLKKRKKETEISKHSAQHNRHGYHHHTHLSDVQ